MTVVPATEHGDFHYEIVARTRAGKERIHSYTSDDPHEVGEVLMLEGRFWGFERVRKALLELLEP